MMRRGGACRPPALKHEVFAMPVDHAVEQGECISSIASRYGFAPRTLWDEGANAGLKRERGDPNILYPGDVVHVPDLRTRVEEGATEQRHRFLRRGLPVHLRLELRSPNGPLANERYFLTVEGRAYEGHTDGDGRIEVPVPPQATDGVLRIAGKRYNVRIGHLNPVAYNSGLRSRLRNLGYAAGSAGEELDEPLRRSLEAFNQGSGEGGGDQAEAARSGLVDRHKC
jgi:hypothetical protein